MKRLGFTLAEVLITLAIIGVIAAISVPSLIQRTNQAELITAWKKTFAMISQGYDKFLFDNGGNISSGYANYGDYYNAFASYYKVIKKCHVSVTTEGCWTNTTAAHPWSQGQGFVMNSGAFVRYGRMYNEAFPNFNFQPTDPEGTLVDIEVDVNGFKPPNTFGKDIFRIWLTVDSVIPAGAQGDNYTADNCKSGTSDFSCSAYYLYSK